MFVVPSNQVVVSGPEVATAILFGRDGSSEKTRWMLAGLTVGSETDIKDQAQVWFRRSEPD